MSRHRRAQHLGTEAADHPPADIFRPPEARRDVDRVEAKPGAQLLRRGRRLRRPVDDPDLDDAIGPSPLEESGHLRPGHTEQLSDARLRLAELVIEPAGLDELFDIRDRHTCTIQMCSLDGNRNGMMAQ